MCLLEVLAAVVYAHCSAKLVEVFSSSCANASFGLLAKDEKLVSCKPCHQQDKMRHCNHDRYLP
jgi:hypothetical protein